MPPDHTIAPLLAALPEGFDFYHLGRIELQATEHEQPLGQIAIAYRIEGDARGVLLLLLDEGLDTSMYSEAGNIIASQLVSRLSREDGLELTLSPPRTLGPAQLKTLLSQPHATARS